MPVGPLGSLPEMMGGKARLLTKAGRTRGLGPACLHDAASIGGYRHEGMSKINSDT